MNIDSSKYYPTHSSYPKENLKADERNQIQMNIQSKREPSTAVTDVSSHKPFTQNENQNVNNFF